jgi:hypothetical protein
MNPLPGTNLAVDIVKTEGEEWRFGCFGGGVANVIAEGTPEAYSAWIVALLEVSGWGVWVVGEWEGGVGVGEEWREGWHCIVGDKVMIRLGLGRSTPSHTRSGRFLILFSGLPPLLGSLVVFIITITIHPIGVRNDEDLKKITTNVLMEFVHFIHVCGNG